jgi:AcrR family transcriptional regulator
MGSRERRDRERQETREKIFAAAREMLAHEGYEAVTMRAIADRIEYTPTTIYHHFANKQALVTELCHQDFQVLAQHFTHAAAIVDPIQRLRLIGEAYLEFAITHPHHYRFLFMTVLPQIEHDPEYLATSAGNPERDAYAFLHLACLEAIEQGRLRPELTDSHEVAQLLWGTLHGLISLQITKRHDDWVPWADLRRIAGTAIDTLIRGIVKDPAGLPFGQPAVSALAAADTKTR